MAGVYRRAAPYADDAMNLPVADVEAAVPFYTDVMGFRVEGREDTPVRAATLARDDVRIRLAENGGDPTQEGCFFEVDDVEAARVELNGRGLQIAPKMRVDKHGSTSYRVFFVVAPDGLCYCIGEREP